jgi:hypothetical protein
VKKTKRLIVKASRIKKNLSDNFSDTSGRVGAPLLMYVLGVPGAVCFFAWLLFFKGK